MLKNLGAIDERSQVILVWMRALSIGNACQLQRLGVMKIRPRALDGLWHPNSRMLKITLIIKSVSKKLRGFE